MMKTYSELILLPTFEERFAYLQTHSKVGADTFGYERYLNQKFYQTKEWKDFRKRIILRDNGCDLACLDRPFGPKQPIYIHHLIEIKPEDIINRNFEILMNPENLISCSFETHQAIHYGDINLTHSDPVERFPNDTCPWLL